MVAHLTSRQREKRERLTETDAADLQRDSRPPVGNGLPHSRHERIQRSDFFICLPECVSHLPRCKSASIDRSGCHRARSQRGFLAGVFHPAKADRRRQSLGSSGARVDWMRIDPRRTPSVRCARRCNRPAGQCRSLSSVLRAKDQADRGKWQLASGARAGASAACEAISGAASHAVTVWRTHDESGELVYVASPSSQYLRGRAAGSAC